MTAFIQALLFVVVAVGNCLRSVIPMNIVKVVAGISFLVFGLWTLRGDKPQLMTVAIAADYHQPFMVLMGTTAGMMVADGIGILGGVWMCRHIPEIYIKWVAGITFY